MSEATPTSQLYRELVQAARVNARLAKDGTSSDAEGEYESVGRKNCAAAALSLTQAAMTLARAQR